MYLLEICGEGAKLQPVWSLINIIINIIMIGVPILLIIFGMVDLGKAVIASKEDEVKKATKAFGKRFLYAVGVFAVVWMVTFVFDVISGVMTDQDDFEYDANSATSGWKLCWRCNIRNGGKGSKCSSKKGLNDILDGISDALDNVKDSVNK